MTKTTVRFYGAYAPALKWLRDNVGMEVHSMPIIFWRGDGWHMISSRELRVENVGLRAGWEVEFDDEKDAIWFALIWQ